VKPPPCSSFSKFGLHDTLLSNIKAANFVKPTPIQQYGIPYAIEGNDIMASAQTGSGKTAAFLLPVLNSLIQDLPYAKDRYTSVPSCLILAPTRELAQQITKDANTFSRGSRLIVQCCYGGEKRYKQIEKLRNGCHILVATPGRLLDFLQSGIVGLKQVTSLILDEADQMLDMGFVPDMHKIIENFDMPSTDYRRTFMFSATFPKQIQQMARAFLRNVHVYIEVGRVGAVADLVEQRIIEIKNNQEKRQELISQLDSVPGQTLVFVERKADCDALGRWLLYYYKKAKTGFIHGNKDQRQRNIALSDFRKQRTRILVATSVASRGLDVPHVAHVINYDLPSNIDAYVHRIGRTGRAGNKGVATAFFTQKDRPLAKKLIGTLRDAGTDVPDWLKREGEVRSYRGKSLGRRYGRQHVRRSHDNAGYRYGNNCYGKGDIAHKIRNLIFFRATWIW